MAIGGSGATAWQQPRKVVTPGEVPKHSLDEVFELKVELASNVEAGSCSVPSCGSGDVARKHPDSQSHRNDMNAMLASMRYV